MNILTLIFAGLFYSASTELINIQPLSEARFFFGTTSLQKDGLIFFAGGLTQPDITIFKTVDIYNAKKNSWSTAFLSQPRFFVSAASLDYHGYAFFAGGLTSISFTFSNIIDIYDANTDKWSITYLSSPRTFIGSTSLNKEGIVLFAGGSNNQESAVVDIYNIFNKSMSQLYLSVARDSLSAVSLNEQNIALFAGGDGQIGQTFSTVDIYNATSNSWSIAQLSVNRTYMGSTVLSKQGLVFFAGGTLIQGSNLLTNIIDIYNVKNNSWTTAQLSVAKQWVGAVSLVNSGLAYFGGGYSFIDGYSFINLPAYDIDVYDVNKNQWFKTSFPNDYQTISASSLDDWNIVLYAGYNKIINDSPVYAFSSCYPGYFNDSITKDIKYCMACELGYFSNIGATQCNICPPGYYCNKPALSSPIPSISGCYNPYQGSIFACVSVCQPGNYCPLGSSQQTQCPQGTYCDVAKLSLPKNCPSGTYNQNIGSILLTDCKTCPSGTYCNSNNSATNIIPCPAQYYCVSGSTSYTACLDGYYCPFATGKPIICPRGSYCPESSSVPVICPSGFYCPEKSNSQIPCEGGKQCPSGSYKFLICPKDTYSLPQSGECTACPYGQFTYESGQSECLICPVSKVNFDGWHCMSLSERLLFAGGWILSLSSICISIWKIRRWVLYRRKKLIEDGISITVRNIFLYKRKKNNVPLIERSFFNETERMKYIEELIFEMKEEIENLKKN